MNKQIDEMTKHLCIGAFETCEGCARIGDCSIRRISERLYNADYRKASDVARNIFGNLRILGHIDFDGNFCIRKDSFEALEKQYESEGADDD